MPPASVPTLCTIPVDSPALDPEFLRTLRIADPGAALEGPLTFAPMGTGSAEAWLEAWRAWRDGTFARVLAPTVLAAAGHAGRGEARELQEVSLTLEGRLPPASAARSARTGARLLRALSATRGERWIARLQTWAAAGGAMHFPVVYAAQSALFHLPLRLLPLGAAYWEWTAALAACPPPAGGSLPEFTAELAGLRAVAAAVLSSRSHADHSQTAFGGA